MSSSAAPARATGRSIDDALAEVAAGATARDRAPAGFPEDAVRALERAGALGWGASLGHRQEWSLLRRIAHADGSVGRIVDGHLNGMERLLALAPGPLRAAEMRALSADPGASASGAPIPPPERACPHASSTAARARWSSARRSSARARAASTRALVTVAVDDVGPGLLAYVDVTRAVEIDRGWYAGSGLRTSESHRVLFQAAPVVAVLGGPGELVREPWFSRDAIRTAACWAGIADRAADAALDALAARERPGELGGLAAGRILGALAGIDRWLEAAAAVADDPDEDLADTSVMLRAVVSDACVAVLDESARALGSRPFAGGGDLDRCRRDLELFLLQHRLDPLVARLGLRALERRSV